MKLFRSSHPSFEQEDDVQQRAAACKATTHGKWNTTRHREEQEEDKKKKKRGREGGGGGGRGGRRRGKILGNSTGLDSHDTVLQSNMHTQVLCANHVVKTILYIICT